METRHVVLKRIPWDGPYPTSGEYLVGPRNRLFLLRRVEPLPHPDHTGARLAVEMIPATRDDLPAGAVLHPARRWVAADPLGPPRVRQTAAEGHAAVMRLKWRDPDDTRPNAASRAKEIAGWHTYCPLRRMSEVKGSQVTFLHIVAADHFRAMCDLAKYGYAPPIEPLAGGSGFGPRKGPSLNAIEQSQAAASVAQAMTRFSPSQYLMLTTIVLRNHSLHAWCAEEAKRLERAKPLDAKVEMGRLLSILDVLADHYERVVAALMATDRALATERS